MRIGIYDPTLDEKNYAVVLRLMPALIVSKHRPTNMAGTDWAQDTWVDGPSFSSSGSSSSAEKDTDAGDIGDLGWLRYVSYFGASPPEFWQAYRLLPYEHRAAPFILGESTDGETAALGDQN